MRGAGADGQSWPGGQGRSFASAGNFGAHAAVAQLHRSAVEPLLLAVSCASERPGRDGVRQRRARSVADVKRCGKGGTVSEWPRRCWVATRHRGDLQADIGVHSLSSARSSSRSLLDSRHEVIEPTPAERESFDEVARAALRITRCNRAE